AGTAGNRLFYLAVADRFFGPAVAALGAAGVPTWRGGPMRPGAIVKPLRPRPPFAQGAPTPDFKKAHGEHDLPHHPFLRPGNGPEHRGAAFCQRFVRAIVEQAADRACSD